MMTEYVKHTSLTGYDAMLIWREVPDVSEDHSAFVLR